MDKLPVYILAGGRSKRFGSDKARVLIGGTPLIRRAADALEPVAMSIKVVAASAGAYQDLGLTTVGDLQPGLGPLGGLDTALADRQAHDGKGWLLLTSCDLAHPDAGLARTLMEHIRPNAQAVVFKGERFEPLFALYHSSIHAAVRHQITSGQGAMWRLIQRADHVSVPLPEGVAGIAQINTPGDHERFGGGVDRG